MVEANGRQREAERQHAILSPYANDRRALTDCVKLVESDLNERKAILIHGFDYAGKVLG